MKNLKNFINLNVDEKHKYIEEYGIFLMDRKIGNRKAFLYFFANMYCEVLILELLEQNEQMVTDIKLFKTEDYLEPYLNLFKIQQLY